MQVAYCALHVWQYSMRRASQFTRRSGADLLKCVKTYNGSRWMGCNLRVEAAKEFYLDRLQEEWRDTAAAAAAADEVEGHCCPPSLPFNKTKVALLPKNSKIRGFGFKRKPYR
jgi:hypothetical protein